MSAGIMLGDRAIYRREPAWHGMAKEIFPEDEHLTASDAFARAGMLYKVGKFPLYTYVRNGGGVPKLVKLSDLGNDNHKVILREPVPGDDSYRVFGVVTDQYELMSNETIGKLLDPFSQTYPVEAAFSLDHGETMAIVFRGQPYDILGDPVNDYTLVTDSKDGKGGSLKAVNTPVRTVCRNTLVTGLASATSSFSIPHRVGMESYVAFATQMLRKVQSSGESVREQFNILALKSVVEDQVNAILHAAYPEPAIPKSRAAMVAAVQSGELAKLAGLSSEDYQSLTIDAEAYQKKMVDEGFANASLRSGAFERYQIFNDTVQARAVAGTAWAVYQAVTELEDYKEGRGNMQQSALFGARAKVKAKAFAAALEA